MPIRYDIDHARRFVHVEAEGDIFVQEVLDYYDALVVHGAMPYPKLWDATKAALKFSDDDLMTLGAWTRAYAEHAPRRPIAVVAVTDEGQFMMRRYMTVGQGERAVKLFSSVAKARDWLDAQPVNRPPATP